MPYSVNSDSKGGFPYEASEIMTTEEKLILSGEERSLTPGEIAKMINKQMEDLPAQLVEDSGSEIFEMCFLVAEEISHRLRGL